MEPLPFVFIIETKSTFTVPELFLESDPECTIFLSKDATFLTIIDCLFEFQLSSIETVEIFKQLKKQNSTIKDIFIVSGIEAYSLYFNNEIIKFFVAKRNI